MQAIILDDMKERHDAFEKRYGQEFTIEHCYNIAQFVHFISVFPGNIDFISLDHDLGCPENVVGTGMVAARCIAGFKSWITDTTKINIHSQNPVARWNMLVYLEKNGGFKVTTEKLD